jgi:putative hydrolase of the HAD superfamily
VAAIETLLFDFGGTLDADGVAWRDRFHTLYRAEGLQMTSEDFAPAFFAADDPLVGRLPATADLDETVQELASNLEVELARRGHTPREDEDRGRRVASRFLSEMSAVLTRNRPVLEALRERYRLGIVSNFYGNLETVCESLGLAPLFAVMTDSQRIGVEKPDPAIFGAALKALNAAPETTVFIGDSLSRDCEGARRAGIGFIWIAPDDVQAAQSQSAASNAVLAAVSSLRDLPDLLK